MLSYCFVDKRLMALVEWKVTLSLIEIAPAYGQLESVTYVKSTTSFEPRFGNIIAEKSQLHKSHDVHPKKLFLILKQILVI